MNNEKTTKAIKARLGAGDWSVVHLGKHEGLEAWEAFVPDGVTGFPFVFLMDGDKIKKELTGFEALDVVTKFVKE